jgi:hypothetical protein
MLVRGLRRAQALPALTTPRKNVYIRQEKVADLLGNVIKPIQITEEIAAGIVTALRASDDQAKSLRTASIQQVENRRRTVVSKIDRGYEHFVAGRISEGFWTRKSAEWDDELRVVDAERARPRGEPRARSRDSRKDSRTREKGRDSLQIAESERTAPTPRNGAIELHVRPRKSQAYIHFTIRSVGERQRNWKLAEREGFEPY